MKTRLQIAASEFEDAYDANHSSIYSGYSKNRPSYAYYNGTSPQGSNGALNSRTLESSPLQLSPRHGLQSRTNSSSTAETEAIEMKYDPIFDLYSSISNTSSQSGFEPICARC